MTEMYQSGELKKLLGLWSLDFHIKARMMSLVCGRLSSCQICSFSLPLLALALPLGLGST
jgi:hypothetical protein